MIHINLDLSSYSDAKVITLYRKGIISSKEFTLEMTSRGFTLGENKLMMQIANALPVGDKACPH